MNSTLRSTLPTESIDFGSTAQLVLEKSGLNTTVEGNVNSVWFGLTYVYGVPSSLNVYGDCFVISNAYIGPEPESLYTVLLRDPSGSNDKHAVFSYVTSAEYLLPMLSLLAIPVALNLRKNKCKRTTTFTHVLTLETSKH